MTPNLHLQTRWSSSLITFFLYIGQNLEEEMHKKTALPRIQHLIEGLHKTSEEKKGKRDSREEEQPAVHEALL